MEEFTKETIQAVWQKGTLIPGDSGITYRKDACKATVKRSEHGSRDSVYGWEIDHIDPNGSDALSNLQPLQWENNVAKSDNGTLKCVVTS